MLFFRLNFTNIFMRISLSKTQFGNYKLIHLEINFPNIEINSQCKSTPINSPKACCESEAFASDLQQGSYVVIFFVIYVTLTL